MNILFLTTQFPYPLDNGGKIGALNGISVLSANNKLTVLSFSEEENVSEGLEYYRKRMPNVKFVPPVFHHVHIRKRYFELCKVMWNDYIRNIPYIMMKFYDKKMFQLIDHYMEMERYEMIFIDYMNMILYGNYIRKKYKETYKYFVFKDHNIEFDIFRQEVQKSKGIRKLIMKHEENATQKNEIMAVKNSDVVFTVCEEDRKILSKFNKKVFTMKPIFEVKPFRKSLTEKNKLLYIGNLSWKANIDGLKWFFENVWDKLKKDVPDIELDIIGSSAKKKLFSDISGVNYIGYLKNLEEIYKNYKVFIVPLFEGSGIRIKILEAFNNDIAVVATSIACGTIEVKDGRELFIADSPILFGEKIKLLLLNDKLNEKIRIEAKNLLKEEYSLNKRVKEFSYIKGDLFENENENF